MAIIAIDPGKDKCGMAVLAATGEVLRQGILKTENLPQELQGAMGEFEINTLVIGNGTTSKKAQETIKTAAPNLRVEVIDEYGTTELARKDYFKKNPPTGWRRFIPLTMQTPPVSVDDYAAVILGRKWLEKT